MKRLSRTFTITTLSLLLLGGAGAMALGGTVAASAASATGTGAMALRGAAAAGNAAGFIYGSDSWPVPVTGKTTTWPMTHLSGSYGGYMGMAGNWARFLSCSTGNFLAYAPTNGAQANDNFINHQTGVGTGVYWYMGGPGVDPHWNNTAAEASNWGARQAAQTLAAMAKIHVTYPVVWADIELPGIKPAPDNGWNNVYTSPCSGVVKQQHIAATIDRAEFNGYANYLTAHSKYKVGVYSEPGIWASIFGTGSASLLPNTYEWTYEPETANLNARPSGWCLSGGTGPCARFFGGQTSSSKYALLWQWSGGGGVRNPYGDYDQIDVARTPK
jgi:hypothetical protein